MLFTRVRREGQGQRERRELSEGGRWALTQDAVRNGIPAPDPQVEGSAELLAIRMTLKNAPLCAPRPCHPGYNGVRLVVTARRLLTHWQRKTLTEAQRDGAPVRETGHVPAQDGGGGRQMAEARPRRRKPHGRLPGPPPSRTRSAAFDGRAGSPAARKEHAAGQVAPDDRQAGRGPRCHDSQSGAVQASHRRRCQGDPAAGQKPKRLAESQGRPESRGAKATGPHCTDQPPVPQSQ